MNPVTVRIHDNVNGHVVTQFLDMYLSSNSTAAHLYNVINGNLAQLLKCENPWNLYTSIGIDNTSVNIGLRGSLKSRITKRNPVYFCGSPCHIIHNTAHKVGEAFTQSCCFDVKDFIMIHFIVLTNQQKERMSFYASVNFVIRNIGRL